MVITTLIFLSKYVKCRHMIKKIQQIKYLRTKAQDNYDYVIILNGHVKTYLVPYTKII